MFTLVIQRRDAPADFMKGVGKGIFRFDITEEVAKEVRTQLDTVNGLEMDKVGSIAEIRVSVPLFIKFRDANLTEHYFALDTIRYVTLCEQT